MTLNELTQHDKAPTPATVSVEAQAEKELGAFFRGELPPPEAPPVAEPVTVSPAPPPVQVAPTTPESGAPTPTAPAGEPSVSLAPPVQVEDPVEKKVQEIFGTDPKRAAEAILATNNRAAAMAGKLKELGLDPKTLQPLPQATVTAAQAPPAPPAPVDPKAIDAEISARLDNDPAFVSLVQTWITGDAHLKEISTQKASLASEVAKINLALSIPEIQADEFKRDQYALQLSQKEQTLLRLQLDESITEAKQERLNAAASRFTEKYRSEVAQDFKSEATQRQNEADLAQYQQELYAQYSTSWPLAVEKAIADVKIPTELVEDFKEDAKVAALAHLQNTDSPIDDVYAFVGARAKVMMDRMDKFHRMQSATYGAQAAARTAVATASTPSLIPSPTVPNPPPTPGRPQLADAAFERALENEANLIARQMGLW